MSSKKSEPKSNRKSGDFSIATPKGFWAGTAACGLKKRGGEDLAIIFSERPAFAAAVFTQNLVAAAPVLVSRDHIRYKTHRAIVVNSGGANACTGKEGLLDAQRTAQLVAEYFNCDEREVLVSSTGVIGVRLDMTKIESGVRAATAELSRERGWNAAEAIMTTDTCPKRASKRVKIGGKMVTIAGIAKGSGMIHPNMATLLAFVTTDAAIGKTALNSALRRAVDLSFNRVTVDGDTSTNDMLAVLANGAAENDLISKASGESFESFTSALTDVCRDLAIQVARDGEGASKLITIHVKQAPSRKDAEKIAVTVATSPLVKTAMAGADANWGRILAAAGRSGAKFDVSKVEIRIGNLVVARHGQGLQFSEQRALEILKRDEVTVIIDLHQGDANVTEWTCDMTEGYIRINADYRS